MDSLRICHVPCHGIALFELFVFQFVVGVFSTPKRMRARLIKELMLLHPTEIAYVFMKECVSKRSDMVVQHGQHFVSFVFREQPCRMW